jgi:chemotaxis protein histidine kinase CheA
VRRMMEDMGGRVSVSSELGQGTIVFLHFPVVPIAELKPGEAALA